ncbi:MAG TPA: DUF1343 domain-containing protein [Longimicrobiales bacterium]|nr:DUF1343 domain-containing protein [Longimicrobiales bacterium]
MRTSVLGLVAPLVLLAACDTGPAPEPEPASARVLFGVDRLPEQVPEVLAGKRVGLITNHTGRDRSGTSTIDVLAGLEGVELVALFAPEHGIRGEASGRIESEVDERTGLPIHSLYGDTRKPTPEMLEGVDALVFDIQDVGARQYTYVSTMALGMEAAGERGIPFVVLDRPNPIGGHIVEGNVLDTAFASFVGMFPTASRHGMTAGELAGMYVGELGVQVDLEVVPIEGWRRTMWLDDTDIPWQRPSPNLPTLESAIHYPGTVFFEGTNLSEGRDSDRPFEQTGAPWLRAGEVADSMNALGLPGVRFEALEYAVAEGRRKFGGQTIPGVRYILTDPDAYRPVAATMLLIDLVHRLHPGELELRSYMDLLAGTDRVRSAIEEGTLRELLREWEADGEAFEQRRRPYLLYE